MKLSGSPHTHARHLGPAPPHPALSWLILGKFYAGGGEDWRFPTVLTASPHALEFALKAFAFWEIQPLHPKRQPVSLPWTLVEIPPTFEVSVSSKAASCGKPSVMAQMGLKGAFCGIHRLRAVWTMNSHSSDILGCPVCAQALC